jgi:hypothetical protein
MAAVARKQESGSFLKKRTKKLLQLGRARAVGCRQPTAPCELTDC